MILTALPRGSGDFDGSPLDALGRVSLAAVA